MTNNNEHKQLPTDEIPLSRQYTAQWFKREHYEAIKKYCEFRPEMQVSMMLVQSSDDGSMCYVRIFIEARGKVIFTQKLVHILVESMVQYYEAKYNKQ
jgi:hypothetical protein